MVVGIANEVAFRLLSDVGIFVYIGFSIADAKAGSGRATVYSGAAHSTCGRTFAWLRSVPVFIGARSRGSVKV